MPGWKVRLHKRKTISEVRWPNRPEIDAVRHAWTADAVTLLLGFVWQGYDLLRQEVLEQIDLSEATDDLERSVTQALEPRIRRSMTGAEPFFVQHGRYEHATRKPAPAQPPQYDLAFVTLANENLCWPIEAKVLRSDTDIGRYIDDVRDQFLTCRYAPLTEEGAMMGYLLAGSTDNAFHAIANGVPCTLVNHPKFANRPHRTSDHLREIPQNESFSPSFRCHHLLMPLQ